MFPVHPSSTWAKSTDWEFLTPMQLFWHEFLVGALYVSDCLTCKFSLFLSEFTGSK